MRIDNQIELLRTKFKFLCEIGFMEKSLNSLQEEFSKNGCVVLNLFNEKSNRFIELASYEQGRIEILVRRVSSFNQVNYEQRNEWVNQLDIALLTHKENYQKENYSSHDLVGWHRVADHIIADLKSNQQYLCGDQWFEVEHAMSLRKLFPTVFKLALTKSEEVFHEVRIHLTSVLENFGFLFSIDNSFYPTYYSKNWITCVVFTNEKDDTRISFGNDDYRDYTEYLILKYADKKLLTIDTRKIDNTDLILSKIQEALLKNGLKMIHN
jgi:hypothetical protein